MSLNNIDQRELDKPISYTSMMLCAQLCISNARKLMKDSEVLSINKRDSMAYFLLILAVEELGKAKMALDFYREEKDVRDLRHYKKTFKRHTEKLKAFYSLFPETSERAAQIFQALKEDFIYVSYDYSEEKWLRPWNYNAPPSKNKNAKPFMRLYDQSDVDRFNIRLERVRDLENRQRCYFEMAVGALRLDAFKGLRAVSRLFRSAKMSSRYRNPIQALQSHP